jgi:drug/metabolite transporter (DMT)-like permease
MRFLFLGVSIFASTVMWPLNRWLTHRGGNAEVYGFWIGLTGALLSGALAMAFGQDLWDLETWLIGAVIGAAFSFGYCFALMRCVRTGPIGPSAAVNNMGLLWPVLLSAVWMDPHPLRPLHWAGLAATVAALVLFGTGSNQQSGAPDANKRISLRWGFWAILTWIAAGTSMSAQLFASLHVPGQQFALLFSFMTVTTLIFLPIVARRGRAMFAVTEMAAGAANGTLQVTAISTMFLALHTLKAEIVFPFSIGTPVILALFLGAVVYRDRIDRAGAAATALGIVGLTALSLA